MNPDENEYFKLECPCCKTVFHYRHRTAIAVQGGGQFSPEALTDEMPPKVDPKLIGYRYYLTCPNQHKMLFEYPEIITCLENL